MTDHISTEDPATYEIEGIPIPSNRCRWTFVDEDGYWDTTCDNAFVFIDGSPSENEFRFCPYCGRPITAVLKPTGENLDLDDGAP